MGLGKKAHFVFQKWGLSRSVASARPFSCGKNEPLAPHYKFSVYSISEVNVLVGEVKK